MRFDTLKIRDFGEEKHVFDYQTRYIITLITTSRNLATSPQMAKWHYKLWS